MFKRNKILLLSLLLSITLSMNIFASSTASSTGQKGFSYVYVFLAVALFVIIYMVYAWYSNSKISIKTEEVSEALNEISQKDSYWNEEGLIVQAEQAFYRIQAALAQRDINELSELLHPTLFAKWENQVNNVEDGDYSYIKRKEIDDLSIIDIDNYKDDEKDTFTAGLYIRANEYTVDNKGNLIYKQNISSDERLENLLTEYWHFEREGEEWCLLSVSKSNDWKKFVDDPIINEDGE